jgi:hypothetical protein
MAVMGMGMGLMTGRLNALLKVKAGGEVAPRVRERYLARQSFTYSMLTQASILTLRAATSTQIKTVLIVRWLIMAK